jgi:hypothetical protein
MLALPGRVVPLLRKGVVDQQQIGLGIPKEGKRRKKRCKGRGNKSQNKRCRNEWHPNFP